MFVCRNGQYVPIIHHFVQGGKPNQNLATSCKVTISEILVKSKRGYNPDSASLTPETASLHAYSVFFQVIDGKNLPKVAVSPEARGR